MEETSENMRDERNVMVLFLSNFLFNDLNKDKRTESGGKLEPKNILYNAADYSINGKKDGNGIDISFACIQTNEAPIKDALYALNGKPLDAVFFFASEKVRGVKIEDGSKEVPREPIRFYNLPEDTEPQQYNSHVEFFFDKRLPSINEDESLKGILKKPLTQEIFHSVKFNESSSDQSAECINAAIRMEEAIKKYMESEQDSSGKKLSLENCNIYTDITGGLRTATMVLSATVQLLHFDGAHLQRVVYSDYEHKSVFDVQPIHDLYTLLAGVYAFTNYGRSEALNDYFGDEKYKPLVELLRTMNSFSDAIQLCQENLFEEKLRKLIIQLSSFLEDEKKIPNKKPKVELFKRMIPKMILEYSGLLVKGGHGNILRDNKKHVKTDRIEIIRWCVKNKLLQQAVTFCTEWLPEYLIDHGVVYIDDLDLQRWIINYKEQKNIRRDSDKRVFLMKCITSKELSRSYNLPFVKGQNQMTTASKAIKTLRNRKVLKTNLTSADLKDDIYYVEEYTYIRVMLRNKVNHADSAGDISDDEITVAGVTERLMKYLDNLALLKGKPKPQFTGLWAKN